MSYQVVDKLGSEMTDGAVSDTHRLRIVMNKCIPEAVEKRHELIVYVTRPIRVCSPQSRRSSSRPAGDVAIAALHVDVGVPVPPTTSSAEFTGQPSKGSD